MFLAVVIAVTLLPALLGFAGHGIDRWRIGRARTGSAAESHHTLSARWARRVIARPGIALAGGLAIMLVLAIPALSMRMGMPDDGSAPESTSRRQAYDLRAEGFGRGFNGPLLIVADTAASSDGPGAIAEVATAMGDDPDHQLPADADVRDPVRALDGLRGVHPLPDPRGLRPHRSRA